ncbi:uncharacterized protein E5676_scaffold529G00530 [Cucumis melo var. makuwa]|uniref:Uncharacterized protein n=1 Tax=Cucumis melo var. makuwa TaxID=1194695 RepID=A0A5D3D6C1_CUCMM|nr:uncharacterized protein E6C27_scaffold56G001130 [Cucumis melo var. makuwa]TYK19082.1 uncharacterized protein E5676_scaffold529G00530 [Cucumis melo var. makuwa]
MKRGEREIIVVVVVPLAIMSLPSVTVHLYLSYGSLCSLKLILLKILGDCIFRGVSMQEMYELRLELTRRCRTTSTDHWNIPYYTEWVYHRELVSFRVLIKQEEKTKEGRLEDEMLKNIEVHMYDSLTDQFFQLHAVLLWTINDFQVYGDLLGWSTKGHQVCSICMGDRSSFGIRGRMSFMGHRRYLLENYVWRKNRLHDGKVERRTPPVLMNGYEILKKLDQLDFPIMSKEYIEVVKGDLQWYFVLDFND